MSTDVDTPRFAVVIPVHDRAAIVHPTLESVQAQTFTDFECLVVDDGSADGDELERVVASLDDERFRYVRQPNGGASSARNRGIDLARAPLVALLDSDDRFRPHKLERCAQVLGDRTEDVLLYSQMVVERGLEKKWVRPARGARPDEPIDEYILCTEGMIRTSTIVVSRSLAAHVRFDESLPWFQDSDFAIRAANTGASIEFIPEPLAVLEDQVGHTRVSRDRSYAPVLAYFDRMRAAGSISDRAYWAGRGWPCARVASSSNRPHAIALYLQAIRRRPFSFKHSLRVAAQVVVPYRAYQQVANLVVRMRGHRAP